MRSSFCIAALALAASGTCALADEVAQLNVDWERRPAPGRKTTDTTLLLGLDYAW